MQLKEEEGQSHLEAHDFQEFQLLEKLHITADIVTFNTILGKDQDLVKKLNIEVDMPLRQEFVVNLDRRRLHE